MLLIKREVESVEVVTVEIQLTPKLKALFQSMENELQSKRDMEEMFNPEVGEEHCCKPCHPSSTQKATKSELVDDPEKYDVENIFTYHPPQPEQIDRYTVLRAAAKEVAWIILGACPESREREQALTKLEEAIFWANASVARNGKSND